MVLKQTDWQKGRRDVRKMWQRVRKKMIWPPSGSLQGGRALIAEDYYINFCLFYLDCYILKLYFCCKNLINSSFPSLESLSRTCFGRLGEVSLWFALKQLYKKVNTIQDLLFVSEVRPPSGSLQGGRALIAEDYYVYFCLNYLVCFILKLYIC